MTCATIFADSQKRTLELEDNIQGDNRIRLNAFEASRFQGGRTELLAGRVTVLGDAVPADAPAYAFSAATFDARLDSDREPGELIALIDRFSPDDRRKATDHLLHDVWPKARDVVGKAELEKTDAPTDEAKAAIDDRSNAASERLRKAERVLEHYFLDEVPASSDELGKVTQAVDPARKAELVTVLRPKQYSAELKAEKKQEEEAKKQGVEKDKVPAKVEPVVFHDPDKFAAEAQTALLKLIDDLYTRYVTNAGKRGTKQEIEQMAVVAKHETDGVFGQFYDIGKHPELRVRQAWEAGEAALLVRRGRGGAPDLRGPRAGQDVGEVLLPGAAGAQAPQRQVRRRSLLRVRQQAAQPRGQADREDHRQGHQ